jgi:hypothetical protein
MSAVSPAPKTKISAISLVPTVEDYTSTDDETQNASVAQEDDKAALDSPSPADYDFNNSDNSWVSMDPFVYPNGTKFNLIIFVVYEVHLRVIS